MSERLAAKHTNSVMLKKNVLLTKDSKSRIYCVYTRPYRLFMFCTTACGIFIAYWFFLAPPLASIFLDHGPNRTIWQTVYWCIVFLIWLLLMLCLILIWRCSERTKSTDDPVLQSYGTNDSHKLHPVSPKRKERPDNLKSKDVRQTEPPRDPISDKRGSTSRNTQDEPRSSKVGKNKDLPPLVIHRRSSGNDVIERVGRISFKEDASEDEEEQSARKDDEKEKKLMEINPQSANDAKSTKESLSPREAFFIDMIREAEKAEKNRQSNPQGSRHFFPHDFSPTKKNAEENAKTRAAGSLNEDPETTYFIADVGSPKKEKTEVFLQITPNSELIKQQSEDSTSEKPILVLKNSCTDEEKRSTEEKIVSFQI